MSYSKNCIYEFVTKSGVSYIGKYIDIDNGVLVFTDVLSIAMRPIQTPEGQYTMAPAMDLVGIFVTDATFKIPQIDIYLMEEVTYKTFLNMYEANLKMFKDAKSEHGPVDKQDTDFSVVRK